MKLYCSSTNFVQNIAFFATSTTIDSYSLHCASCDPKLWCFVCSWPLILLNGILHFFLVSCNGSILRWQQTDCIWITLCCIILFVCLLVPFLFLFFFVFISSPWTYHSLNCFVVVPFKFFLIVFAFFVFLFLFVYCFYKFCASFRSVGLFYLHIFLVSDHYSDHYFKGSIGIYIFLIIINFY